MVNTVPSSLTTAQRWVPNDSVTISAPAGRRQPGRHRDLRAVRLGRLRVGGDAAIYSDDGRRLRGLPADGVDVEHHGAQTDSGSFSWSVSYDSTNPAQEDIPASCHETSALTIDNTP